MSRPRAACYLCKETALLCDSHLIPKAMYRLCMAKGEKNPNPFLVTPRIHIQKSAQWRDYLLCEHCENRIRIGGEDWVLRHCCRSTTGKPFLLRDAIKAGKPELVTSAGAVYSCKTLAGVDADKLLYFGTSVFWRAAQKRWRLIGVTLQPLEFGPFDEQLRLFLLGKQAFPHNAALNVWVSDLPEPWSSISFPVSIERNQHCLYTHGIGFNLSLGNQIEDFQAMMNIAAGSQPIMLSGYFEQRLRDGTSKAFRSSLPKLVSPNGRGFPI
jgi:hypothetical protein